MKRKIDNRTVCKLLEKRYTENPVKFCKNVERILKSIISRTGKGSYKLTYLALPEDYDLYHDLAQYIFFRYELIYPQSKIVVFLCGDPYSIGFYSLLWIGRNGETKYTFSVPNPFYDNLASKF